MPTLGLLDHKGGPSKMSNSSDCDYEANQSEEEDDELLSKDFATEDEADVAATRTTPPSPAQVLCTA